ncbi:MAG: hypothetical protein P0S94_03155 [Simkaniaceae bacterium]|nr:hypothetical protein [Simkaniaceae bacterium]
MRTNNCEPLSFIGDMIPRIGGAVIALTASIISIVTVRTIEPIEYLAKDLVKSREIAPRMYAHIMRLVNPRFSREMLQEGSSRAQEESHLYKHLVEDLQTKAFSTHKRSDILKFRLAAIAVRVTDLTIVPFLMIASVFPFMGRSDDLNRCVFAQLKGFGFIDDFFTGIRDLILPQEMQEIQNQYYTLCKQ